MRQIIRSFRLITTQKQGVFGMFQEKYKESQSNKQEPDTKKSQSDDSQKSDNEMSKEEYIQKLRKEREAKEQRDSQFKSLEEAYNKERLKDNMIKYGDFDAAKSRITNINLFPNEFLHPDQLFYYIEHLETRLTEENLAKCVKSFLNFSEQITSQDLERPQFQQFLQTLDYHFNIVYEKKNLLDIVLFSDIYCIENPDYWENLERRLMRSLSEFTIEEKISLFTYFSNQKEGSEVFHNKFEVFFRDILETLSFKQLSTIALNFKNVQFGTTPFMAKVFAIMIKKFQQADFEDLLRLTRTLQNIESINTQQLFLKIEEKLALIDLTQITNKDLCEIAKNFGFQNGSETFFKQLEQNINIDNCDLHSILHGFIFTYRGSKELLEKLIPKIYASLDGISVIDQANIAKAYYILEVENEQLYKVIERKVLEQLKNVSLLSVQEIFEVAKSFNITRLGSRELYKVLELVIEYRLAEILKNHDVVRGLHQLYTKSGLISLKLLKKLEKVG